MKEDKEKKEVKDNKEIKEEKKIKSLTVNDLKVGGRYLLKKRSNYFINELTEIFIEEVSEFAVKFRYTSNSIRWVLKEDFNDGYEIVERLDTSTSYDVICINIC
jgi:uncharacterized protein (UPF0305 family)